MKKGKRKKTFSSGWRSQTKTCMIYLSVEWTMSRGSTILQQYVVPRNEDEGKVFAVDFIRLLHLRCTTKTTPFNKLKTEPRIPDATHYT
jgi:hypothetical protein